MTEASNDIMIVDSGYSTLKGYCKGKWIKEPTSISYAPEFSVGIGETTVYEFEGEKFIVGPEAVGEGSFATTEYRIKEKFDPLIIKRFRDTMGITDIEVPTVRMSLALIDWHQKDNYQKRCSEFVVNGVTIRNNVSVVPQGIGAYYDYVVNSCNNVHPTTAFVIEIGYNTINVMYFEQGVPVKSKSKGYPNHGVSSIIRPFTTYMESKYSMSFSEQEALKIFSSGKFLYQGALVPEVTNVIRTYSDQFVKKLFNSILISDKKLVSTSEAVILAGGGVYFLENTTFPPNVNKVQKPYEYSNARGMNI